MLKPKICSVHCETVRQLPLFEHVLDPNTKAIHVRARFNSLRPEVQQLACLVLSVDTKHKHDTTCVCTLPVCAGVAPTLVESLTPRMRGSRTHQKGRETQVTSSVRERSYTYKKEALVLKRQPRASLANFLSQYLTFQSVLAFLDVDPKKYTEQGTLLSAQFFQLETGPKSSPSPGTETGPRFWLSSSNVQAHAIRGPKLELRLGSHFWGPNYAVSSRAEATSAYTAGRCVQSKQNLAQLCSAASCRCSFKT